ncbi:MAG: SPOR domain-containing protein [Rhodocyclales bacterium]|nr:SPOR domain-containing protein [Rhodocyclales bacterium]
MNQIPTPNTDPAADQVSKARLVNRIVVVALLVVGLVGGWVMFDAIYTPGQPLPLTLKHGAPPKSAPAAKPRPEPAMAARTTESAAPGAQAGESQYVLQLNVAGNAAAEDLRARLERQGIASSIEIRVTVGPFRTREGVDAARAKLKELGLDGGLLITTTK